jgi:hypothetical protein
VTDPQGGIVVGATVTLTSNETGRVQQATTGDEGFYRFSGLPPGRYTITVEQTGFGRKTLEDVVVNAAATEGINIALETAGLSETITVMDVLAPPLETENANLGKAISNQEIRQLPQFGRDPYELLRLTPGVFGQGARAAVRAARSTCPTREAPAARIAPSSRPRTRCRSSPTASVGRPAARSLDRRHGRALRRGRLAHVHA